MENGSKTGVYQILNTVSGECDENDIVRIDDN